MLSSFHFPSYFNKTLRQEIGELYANTAIANIALSIAMLFEPIFLYKVLGFNIVEVLLFMSVVYAVYIFTMVWGGKIASLYGYKHAIAMSAPFQILYWALLLYSRDNPSIAFFAAIAFAIQKSLYWPGYHSLLARYANHQQVGREFGVVYAIENLTQIIGPLIGGIIAQKFGIGITFVLAAIIYCTSVIPLFTTKEIFQPKIYSFKQTWELYKNFPKKALGYLGFGEELLVLTIWPIFIYIIIKDYAKVGIIATLASLIAALFAIVIGKVTDQYTKRVLIKLGAFFSALIWLARYVVTTAWSALAIDTLSRTSKELDFIPISTVTYLRAEATHVVPYVIFFEQSLAVGKLTACLLGMLLFYLTGSFMVLFILAALYSLLYMYI